MSLTNSFYLHYNLYLDAPVNYSRLENVKILKIKENISLTDKLVTYIIENSIKYIEFGEAFNQPINKLPNCVEHIYFHPFSNFNHPFVNLPSNIKTLIIGSGYWETLDYLPSSLLYLGYYKSLNSFNEKYNSRIQKFEDIFPNLPPNILYITIPIAIYNKIYFSNPNVMYNKKIIKCSSELAIQFINVINERHNMDYFCVHG
jgi:hypothetical protein